MKDEIKGCVRDSLLNSLDPYMLEQGFSRSKSSLIYKRLIHGSTQKIELSLQIHPKDDPNAAAAVYPQMEVLIPAADTILEEMIGDNLGLLEGITGGTSKQPIAFTSEKAHDGRWLVIIPFLSGRITGLHAASLSFMAGVMPPMPMFGRWLL